MSKKLSIQDREIQELKKKYSNIKEFQSNFNNLNNLRFEELENIHRFFALHSKNEELKYFFFDIIDIDSYQEIRNLNDFVNDIIDSGLHLLQVGDKVDLNRIKATREISNAFIFEYYDTSDTDPEQLVFKFDDNFIITNIEYNPPISN